MTDQDKLVVTFVANKISEITGVQLGEKQLHLVKARLNRRLTDLKLKSYSEYNIYLKKNYQEEIDRLVSLMTTHHTYFFREKLHFDFLEKNIDKIIENVKKDGRNEIRIWTAACSWGHEAYSIAMFIDDLLDKKGRPVDYKILASDVDPQAVGIGKNGVYRWSEVKKIPSMYLNKYWSKGVGEISDYVKVKNIIRSKCDFITFNLVKDTETTRKFDIIFCRNVFIYFDDVAITKISNHMIAALAPKGFFFTGLSENLSNHKLIGQHIGQSIYTRMDSKTNTAATPVTEVQLKNSSEINTTGLAQVKRKKRVLCVDDSETIIKILNKLINNNDFEIVGTAKNGIEAAHFLKNNSVDIVTLDIHMPEMDGITYLEKHFHSSHPPVIMVTSVSRESAGIALRALELGAMDYVEKPSLENMKTIGDELLSKMSSVCSNDNKNTVSMDINKKFSRSTLITNVDTKLKVFVCDSKDLNRLPKQIVQLSAPQPAILILIRDGLTFSNEWAKSASLKTNKQFSLYNHDQSVLSNRIYVGDYLEYNKIILKYKDKKIVQAILGELKKDEETSLLLKNNFYTICEDLGSKIVECHRNFTYQCQQCIPFTSFTYATDQAYELTDAA